MIISGTAKWAKLEVPSNNFDPEKKQWSIDVCNLDEDNLKVAKSQKMSIKNADDDRGDYVTLTRNQNGPVGGMNGFELVGVQVVELVPYEGGADSTGSDFQSVDDGYVSEDSIPFE